LSEKRELVLRKRDVLERRHKQREWRVGIVEGTEEKERKRGAGKAWEEPSRSSR
jgi:hypothetical protein